MREVRSQKSDRFASFGGGLDGHQVDQAFMWRSRAAFELEAQQRQHKLGVEHTSRQTEVARAQRQGTAKRREELVPRALRAKLAVQYSVQPAIKAGAERAVVQHGQVVGVLPV